MTFQSHKITLSRPRLTAHASVRLVMPTTADGAQLPDAVWVQVANEGDFRGYVGGRFKFDRSIFDTIVANFRQHPAYESGGVDVVPWDFHHASEYAAADGSIPVNGAPAQGWVRELDVRVGADGKSELWALTRWLEPARSYIKDGRYKWASVVVDFGARNAETNEKVGATLISVAITNNPFIEGMAPLVAADRTGGRRVAAQNIGGLWVEPACSAEDALDKLRQVLGMPATRPVGEVIAQVMQLQEWTMSGGQPLGVDLNELVGAVRVILNMPALASNEEVFAEAGKLLQRLLESVNMGVPDAMQPQPLPPAAMPVATRKTDAMSLKILAAKLSVQENDAAVIEAVESLLMFRALLCTMTGLEPSTSNRKLLEAGELAGKGGSDARGKLTAILGALGLDDAASGEAINKIAQVMEQSAKLKEVMPELEALRTEAKKAEAAEEEKDVDEAMAAKGLSDEGVRAAFLAQRRSDKTAFFAKNPKTAKSAATSTERTTLTQPVATNAAGQGLEVSGGQLKVLSLGGKKAKEGRINLSAVEGRNLIEKAMVYLAAQPGGDKLTRDQLWQKACELNRAGMLDETAA